MTRRLLNFALTAAAVAATAAPAAAARLSCPGGTTGFDSPTLTVERGLHSLSVTVGHGPEALSYIKIGTIKGELRIVTIPAIVFGASPECTVVVGGEQWPMSVLEPAMDQATTLIDASVGPRATTGVLLGRTGDEASLAGQEGEDFVLSGTLPASEQIVITDTSAGFWLGGDRHVSVSLYELAHVAVADW